MGKSARLQLALPAGWPNSVRSAVVHAMSLACATMTATRGWAADHISSRVRLVAEIERYRQEVALLQEEVRLKDDRMTRVPGHERPHFPPIDRLAILELRAVRGWSVRQTADRFLLSPATVSYWVRRLDEKGSSALVQSPVPLNKFPDFVAHVVQQLKLLCPSLGYAKIAHFLCRAGLHLGKSTVRRMIRRAAGPEPELSKRSAPVRRVVARYPHHAWHCDLTTVPTSMGLSTSIFPFAFAQRWPFCWWLVVLADQFSCRIIRLESFRKQPSAQDVQDVMARAVRGAHVAPRYVITDRGHQFRSRAFRAWCTRIGIHHLFGALGQVGSIPFIERLVKTIKSECTRRILFPYLESAAREELELFRTWYNGVRPHWRLRGATPDEVHDGVNPFWEERARFEPRSRWPRDAPCASPQSRVGGRCGAMLLLRVRYLAGRRHLPIVTLERVA